ncbi:enoyl-CoA hydratase/isomerase family protein [Rhodococcus opacus]|uniref:Enoyl-CoA hydratase n=1 Tax=Rhodococcus opacus TaxID=37919 RepID=A0A2S8J8Z4_RHOOP|nr:enoyl-CoA hydratase/isomerase family protein [Rhodococcus opacus]PQP23433.1 enoyl-CoA hydratase [Rhodococcus opacus]
MPVSVNYQDKIAVLDLGDGENRFTPDWLDTVEKLIDDIERTRAQALVTSATGKFYSYGLDLDWMTDHADKLEGYFLRAQRLFSRILTFPMPTIAAINGHAFGAGAMLAVAHDYRVMRADRGYFCFPEVDVHVPFTPGMAALIQGKSTPAAAITAMSTGHRYGAAEAHTAGYVDGIADQESLVESAIGFVRPLCGKDPATLGAIKSTMFASVVAALHQ